ncbi:MAG: bifunctional phosphoribosylaminoimidazolecarboxamide formyltransferase/IMP cyclohydrolase [Gemmatimonadota bacterium]|nr:bifunctional phosphoribosylaminoimidazolecarboxamide formyltransferase/IMP cyclohydrolase [Gemmatimonadota bacterium]MDE3215539.1 bifunctional phosphoribosylaminoimidazolecarboxamide formyltransferase/IMP cyclohydrolase [Gemmatimonadota bacterium]
MPTALLSVSNKSGLVDFAQGLAGLGWSLVSTGGTARALRDAGLPARDISDVTGFPEMLDGRVKTLHPVVHGGLLARRDLPEHMAAIAEHHIAPIDLVVVNLYPFRETAAKAGVTPEEVIENIDIGGPSMLRSAAKNFASVYVVVDPADYGRVLEALRAGDDDLDLRRLLAGKAYAHTASYDAAIGAWFARERGEQFPQTVTMSFELAQSLRYGENPGQAAAFYVERPGAGLSALEQKGGKELSFNNLIDLEGALLAVAPFGDEPACAIIKHTTPCGLAVGRTAREAYEKALACDPVSAFGSVIAFNVPVDEETADAVASLFVECIVAPKFAEAAVEVLGRKKNLRVLEGRAAWPPHSLDYKRVRGGVLVQERSPSVIDDAGWTVPTRRQPTTDELADLLFAWRAVASVKSNAIVLTKRGATIGIGAGQMSRVDASFIAAYKARAQGHDTAGSVMGSDAFFPFRDGVDQAAAAGVTAIVQPGGSVRDAEVIAAADEHGMAMVFTGKRQFRH